MTGEFAADRPAAYRDRRDSQQTHDDPADPPGTSAPHRRRGRRRWRRRGQPRRLPVRLLLVLLCLT
jgi:hypothetical protein